MGRPVKGEATFPKLVGIKHDGTTIGGCFRRVGGIAAQEGVNRVLEVVPGERALAETDVIEGALIAQNSRWIDDKQVRGGLGAIDFGDLAIRVAENKGETACGGDGGELFGGLIRIGRNGEQDHVGSVTMPGRGSPPDQGRDQCLVSPFRPGTFRRPEVQYHVMPAIIRQMVNVSVQVKESKIRCRVVKQRGRHKHDCTHPVLESTGYLRYN